MRVLLALLVLVAACGPGASETRPDEARGEQLYLALCQSCHGGATGGKIDDIPPPHNAQGHTWHHPDCHLVQVTLEGIPRRPEVPPGLAMPAFGDNLTEEDVEAILAFIKTWWTEEQRELQADLTERACD